MERNIRITLAYDGADFHGWQRQPGQRTVQESVEDVVRRVCAHPLTVFGASRTDAGVHARGQVANFKTTCPIPANNLALAIGHHLPDDVSLVHLREAPSDFHASGSAVRKLYRYRIHAARARPVESAAHRCAWHVWHPLDLETMRAAAKALVGTHDFAGFASAGDQRATTVRTLYNAQVEPRSREICIDFLGNGFLYNQVRNMVGTLVEIARGHWPVDRIPLILNGRDRGLAGPTAPAHGLSLEWIQY